jgi:hypothetical protein
MEYEYMSDCHVVMILVLPCYWKTVYSELTGNVAAGIERSWVFRFLDLNELMTRGGERTKSRWVIINVLHCTRLRWGQGRDKR